MILSRTKTEDKDPGIEARRLINREPWNGVVIDNTYREKHIMNLWKLAAVAALAACTTQERDSAADSARAQQESAAVVTVEPADTVSEPTADVVPGDIRTWTVNARGLGPLSAGMTLAEANAAAGGNLIIPARMEECDWVRLKDAPDGLLFMVEKGKISRVDVTRTAPVTTAEGAKIGDTEARIKSLYSGKVTVQPHEYTDGHYLVVTPQAVADSAHRIVFETDGSKVLRYRSGKRPSVEYVEGCS